MARRFRSTDDNDGNTPLHDACKNGHLAMVRVSGRRAWRACQRVQQQTALRLCTGRAIMATLLWFEYLVEEHGAHVNVCNNKG